MGLFPGKPPEIPPSKINIFGNLSEVHPGISSEIYLTITPQIPSKIPQWT